MTSIDVRNLTKRYGPLTEVGALLDAGAVHGGRTAYDHLLALAASNGLPRRRVGEVLACTGLEGVAGRRAGVAGSGGSCGRSPARAGRCWSPATS